MSRKQKLRTCAFSLSELLVRTSDLSGSFAVAERGRSRVLLDLLARSDRDLLLDAKGESSEMASSLGECLALERGAQARLLLAENVLASTNRSPLQTSQREQRISEKLENVNDARRDLGRATTEVFRVLSAVWPDAKPGTQEEIRRALKSDEVLLSYVFSWNAVTAFVLRPWGKGGIWGKVLVDGEDAVKKVTQSLKQLGESLRRHGAKMDTASLKELANRLASKEVRDKVSSARRLILVDDGWMQQIPFELFLGIDEGPTLVYSPSATVFLNRRRQMALLQKTNARVTSALLLGNPVVDSQREAYSSARRSASQQQPTQGASPSRLLAADGSGVDRSVRASQLEQIRLYGGDIPRLPGTQREVERISELLRESGVQSCELLGMDASLPKLEESVEGARFLHLATHGLQGTNDRPYDASLALARPQTPTVENIGFLTLDRLIRRWRGRLSACELVVLSACDTQNGTEVGDSVVSLPWGFFYAGAPAVVGSLWKAHDEATALLMGRFYENLLGPFDKVRRVAGQEFQPGQEIPKPTALREAKLWIRGLTPSHIERLTRGISGLRSLEERRTDFSHPFYWAGFMFLGAPD